MDVELLGLGTSKKLTIPVLNIDQETRRFHAAMVASNFQFWPGNPIAYHAAPNYIAISVTDLIALHRYKVHRDVRLVFSPEAPLAEYGIEGAQYTFPQYRFKATFLRVYEDGKPLRTPHLALSESAPREGEPVFLAAFPPATNFSRSREADSRSA